MATEPVTDNRNVVRTDATANPQITVHPHGHVPPVVIGVSLTPQQVKDQAGTAATAADSAYTVLKGEVPVAIQMAKVNRTGIKPDSAAFATEAAKVQTQVGTALGDLPTDPARIINALDVAQAAADARGHIESLVTLLANIEVACLRSAIHDGEVIYQRAKAVAATNTTVDKAIAKLRDARSRIGKKGAATKKHKAKQSNPGPTPSTPEASPGTVTTTTSTR